MDFGILANMVGSALAPTWHRARIECFVDMLRGLLTTQSVNTYRLARRMSGAAQFESHAQRIAFVGGSRVRLAGDRTVAFAPGGCAWQEPRHRSR